MSEDEAYHGGNLPREGGVGVGEGSGKEQRKRRFRIRREQS